MVVVLLMASGAIAQSPESQRSQEDAVQWSPPKFAGLDKPLAIREQLMLTTVVVEGRGMHVMYFARPDIDGAVASFPLSGDDDACLPLREHWRNILYKRLEVERREMSSENRRKVDAAIEVTINRLVRDYRSAAGLLNSNSRDYVDVHARLTVAGRRGPWAEDPLLRRVLENIAATSGPP